MKLQRGKKKLVAEINVVPYIDVMLVLLIVFMVAAPLLIQGVELDLPDANSAPLDTKEKDPIIISVKPDGSYYWALGFDGEDTKVDRSLIADQVSKIIRQEPTTPVLVRGDDKVPYGDVVRLMSDLQGAGVKDVGLVTEPLK